MALVLQDRVKELSNSSGTGNITLAGAYDGYRTFNSCVANGSTVYYTIHNTTVPNDTEWEVGIGTFTSPATLSRDTVLSSSNSGSLVSFSTSSDLEVFITQPSEKALYVNGSNIVEAYGNGANVITFAQVNTTNLVANTVTLTAGTISTNAANATDITNKTYVDGLFSQSISYHDPVLVESPTALNAVYVQPNGAGNGVGATLTNNGANVALVIDGVTLSNTARVLVYTQANAVQNGIYTVTNPGNVSAQWVLTRATDADTFGLADPNKLGQGDAVFVQSGDTGAGETYVCNTPGTITFGSSNISFVQISTAQIYSAGTGLSLTNTTFSISNTAVTAAQYGNDGNVAQITVNAQGQLTNAANVAINASSISVGTLANARTTASDANGASTIVSRDANGSFTANVVNATTVNATTGTFTSISGNGIALTAINASNISSGTLDNARTTANTANSASTIVARDADGSFGANIVTATFSGNAAGLSAINASNISSGTIANARTTAASANGASTIVLRDSGGSFEANTVNASAFVGNGVQITAINASNLTTGTVDNARTTASSANGASTIVLRDTNGSFSANVVNANSFSGNGASITAINASNISSGTIGSAYVSGAYGSITGVGTLTSGTWNANVIANAYTTANSANSASTIVARDSNGSFAANVVTASFSGNGATITDINASNLTSGTVNTARISGSYTGITGAGTLTAGTWNANVISAQYGGTGSANLTADNVILGNGANTVKVVAPGTNGNVLTSNGTTWVSQAFSVSAAGSNTQVQYNNSGVLGASSDFTYNSSTKVLAAPNHEASNGLFVNNMTVGSSYSIPSGYSASSVGPVTVGSGVSVSIPSGSRWVVL